MACLFCVRLKYDCKTRSIWGNTLPVSGVTPGALEVQCAALQGPDAVRRAARRRHDPSVRETRKFEPFILSDKNK
ncbi:hypothetical protein LB504_009395 [Fusarium proliferatum]|nr:hypothetical protein LB504_009395 [Fusarium proliferatum]